MQCHHVVRHSRLPAKSLPLFASSYTGGFDLIWITCYSLATGGYDSSLLCKIAIPPIGPGVGDSMDACASTRAHPSGVGSSPR